MPRTLFEKIWDSHVVLQEPDSPAVLYIDLHLIHEVTTPQAFALLRERGIAVRRPNLTLATMDHNSPPTDRTEPFTNPDSVKQVEALASNCAEFGITCFFMHDPRNGIVHIIGPELGGTRFVKTTVFLIWTL